MTAAEEVVIQLLLLMALIDLFRKLGILRPASRFKVGDQVQKISGGPLMIVQSVELVKTSQTYLINCKWYDSKTKESRTNLFREDHLKSFDWYQPN